MAQILQEFTIVRRILPPDSLPWPLLVLPSVIDRLRDRYKFEEISKAEGDKQAIAGKNGEVSKSGMPQAIQLMAFEPNIVHTQSSGGTDVADHLFEDIGVFLHELDPSRDIGAEYTKTVQTIAVAKLSVPFERIFSEKFLQFQQAILTKALVLPDGKPNIALANLSFRVGYATDRTDFVYLPKPLTLEPRSGSKLSDCIYYTQSPTDPETHRKLLEEFERTM